MGILSAPNLSGEWLLIWGLKIFLQNVIVLKEYRLKVQNFSFERALRNTGEHCRLAKQLEPKSGNFYIQATFY